MSRLMGVALLLLLFFLAVAAGAQRTRRRPNPPPRAVPARAGGADSQVERAGDQTFGVNCRTYCSDEVTPPAGTADDARPRRAAIAEITWRVSATQLQPRDLESRAARQGIEVTVYKDGFGRGRFASMPSVGEGRPFSPPGGQDANTRIPGLGRLTIRDVRAAGAPDAPDSARDRPSNVVAVEVEGLEAGLNYFWRLTSAVGDRKVTSEVVRCQAPTCPVDFQPGGAP